MTVKYVDFCQEDGTVLNILPDLAIDSGNYTEQDIYSSEVLNANGKRIADYLTTKVTIDCIFPPLSSQEWNDILSHLDSNKTFYVKYFSPRTKQLEVIKAYVMERVATPNFVSEASGEPEFYTNCGFQIIEV